MAVRARTATLARHRPAGRDLYAHAERRARSRLQIGLLATLVSLLIGVTWGATAGYLGRRVDELMMPFVDIPYALPYIFIVIILSIPAGNTVCVLFIRRSRLADDGADRPRPDAVAAQGVHRGGAGERRVDAGDPRRATSCQRDRSGDHLAI